MDADYDEDLSENKFLQELKQQHETTLQRVIQEGWIICVPRSGSFADGRKLQESEINAHILIPRQDLSIAHFDTLNGRQVVFIDRVLTVKCDNAEPYSSRLLFEEIFYNEDLRKYCIWCVEQPLEISMHISDNHVSVITNLQEAVNFLQTELLEGEFRGNLEAKIKDFLYTNKNLNCKSVQTQRDLVHALYIDCLETLLQNAALRKKFADSRHYYCVKVSLETYILYTLRHVLLRSLSARTIAEDASLNKIARNLDEIQLTDLRVRPDLQSRIQGGRLELSRLDCFVTVLGKIECLRRTVNYMSRGTSSVVTSDDLLPMLIFLVIKVGLSNWTAQLTFMRQFRFSVTRTTRDMDEDSFLTTSLEAAIEHIKSGAIAMEYPSPGYKSAIARELVDLRNTLDHSERSFIDRLFACIAKGELTEVERMLAYNESSNQLNDIALCHPLCICASCERNWTKRRELNACPKDDRGFAPLHIAVLHDQMAIVDFLLEHETDVNIVDSDGLTALHYACSRGHQGIVLRLLHANADPTVTDFAGNTPLHLAVNCGHDNCVKALLYLSEQIKVSVDANAANSNGDTALHLAAKWGYGAIACVLLECGAHCKPTNKKGQTPLTITYSKYIAELLEYYTMTIANAPSNSSIRQVVPFQRVTPMDQSSLCSNSYANTEQRRTIDRLLAAIVEGDTCLACYYLGLEMYRKRSVKENDVGNGLCHPLCNCEHCMAIEESLSERCERGRPHALTINACNDYGETALHVASATGRTEMVRLLLDAGANVNVVTMTESRTPLHLACLNDNVEVVRLLLNCATCNVDAADHDGDTPLHLVTKAGNARFVSLLVRHGANTNVRNQRNMTPLQQLELEITNAFSANYTNVLKILKQNSLHSVLQD